VVEVVVAGRGDLVALVTDLAAVSFVGDNAGLADSETRVVVGLVVDGAAVLGLAVALKGFETVLKGISGEHSIACACHE
jgi:hypothetical protein